MIKFDKYKHSNIDWIVEIPNEWKIDRVTNICEQNKIKNKNLNERNLLSLSYGKIVQKDIDSAFGLLPESFENYQIIEHGDIILRLTDLQNDKKSLRVGFSEQRGIITSAYLGLKFNKSVNSKYIFYLLYLYDIKKVFYSQGGSMRQSMKFDDFKTMPLILPNKSYQDICVNYLDIKTTAIDKKIELFSKKNSYYKELRKRLINDVVSKGLDNNVELKDSGIDWIGKIPKQWDITRLKAIGTIETSSVDKKINENEDLVKLVNYTDVYNIQNKEIRNRENYMVVSANNTQKKSKRLIKGDVLFTPSSETLEDIGVSAVVMEDLENTLYSYHLLRLRFNRKIDLNFKKYLFNNSFVQTYFSKSATGTTRKILGLNTFNNLPLIIPNSIEEQIKIAEFLDKKTQTIDSIVENINKQIETLKELRKSLINDVVTGKIKVVDN